MTSTSAGRGVTGFMNAALGFRALFFFPVAVFFFAVLAINSPHKRRSKRQRVVSRKFAHYRAEKGISRRLIRRGLAAGTRTGLRIFEIREVAVAVLRVASFGALLH